MSRPYCPKCKKHGTVVTSRESGGFLLQYYGCRQCGVWDLGNDTIPLKNSSSTNPRDRTGRFAIGR